jgi:hypothetical protein
MSLCRRAISVSFAGRPAQTLAGLAMLSALVLGQEALLIHDHHGHDVHCHPIALDEFDVWSTAQEEGHHEHEHDGQPPDRQSEDGGTVVIVYGLPDFALGLRVLSGASPVWARLSPAPVPVAILSDAAGRNTNPRPRSLCFAPLPWAGDAIVGLLLSNHALLL